MSYRVINGLNLRSRYTRCNEQCSVITVRPMGAGPVRSVGLMGRASSVTHTSRTKRQKSQVCIFCLHRSINCHRSIKLPKIQSQNQKKSSQISLPAAARCGRYAMVSLPANICRAKTRETERRVIGAIKAERSGGLDGDGVWGAESVRMQIGERD